MRVAGGKVGKNRGFGRYFRAPVISAACILLSVIAAPTVVNAFSKGSESAAASLAPVNLAARGGLGSFTPASVDTRLIAQVSVRALSHGTMFRFTPAGLDSRPDRAVTVAVRLPDANGHLMATHNAQGDPGQGFAAVRIAPVAYNLGTARGYQSFALSAPSPLHGLGQANDSYGSELRAFSLTQQPSDHDTGTTAKSSPRLEANVAMIEQSAPGLAPRTLGTQGDYEIKMGGAYRLVGNLAVTAGLRYATDRDRLRALTDHRQDSQALYVGTQFRF